MYTHLQPCIHTRLPVICHVPIWRENEIRFRKDKRILFIFAEEIGRGPHLYVCMYACMHVGMCVMKEEKNTVHIC